MIGDGGGAHSVSVLGILVTAGKSRAADEKKN